MCNYKLESNQNSKLHTLSCYNLNPNLYSKISEYIFIHHYVYIYFDQNNRIET